MRRQVDDNLAVRIFSILCALALSVLAVRAQEPNRVDGPNIEILKLHWEKQVRLPRNFDPAVMSTGVTANDPIARTAASGPPTAADATRAATSAQSNAA